MKKTNAALAAAKQRDEKLAKQLNGVKRDLAVIQRDSVNLAQDIQDREAAVLRKQQKLDTLQRDIAAKRTALESQKAELADLLSAVIRLRRTPSAAIFAQPSDMPHMLRTGSALEATYESIELRSAAIAKELEELASLSHEEKQAETELREKTRGLKSRRATLEQTLAERSKLQVSIEGDREKELKRVAELSKRSANLQQLLDKLAKAPPPAPKPAPVLKPAAPTTKPTTSSHRPVAGQVVRRYGQSSATGMEKGVTYRTADGAQVTSPAAGDVAYTGTFMDYGRMVIVRHDAKHLSLLAGLSNIGVRTGQHVLAGEPLGQMGSSGTKGNQLYFELRQGSKPIDPLAWLANVGRSFAQR